MELLIDEREQGLKQLFPPACSKMLEIGDVQIGSLVVIERKTLADLSASIQDGRYHNQKNAILNSSFKRKIYLLEGLPEWSSEQFQLARFNGIIGTAITSSVVNMIVRDGIQVIFSKNLTETAYIISALYSRILANPEKYSTDSPEPCVPVIPKMGKKHSIFVKQLCQIPGISVATAEKIVSIYPSVIAFYSDLSPLSEVEKKEKLQSIVINQKRLSKTVVDNIVSHYF